MTVRSASRLRRAEEAEERYRQLFLEMPVGMFVYSGADGRLEPNPALATMLGYQGPEHMMSERPAEGLLVDAGDLGRLREALFRDGVVSNFVSATERLDGSRVWVSMDARAVVSGDTLELLEGVVRDITDQVTTDTELRTARAKYQAVVIRVGAAALASSNDGQLLQEATASMARVLEVPLAAAFEIQHEHETVTVRALVADTDTAAMTVGTTFALSELSSYRVVPASGLPVAVDDYEGQTEFSRNEMMTRFGVRASVTALIPGAERALGTLVLYSRSPRAWTSYEVEFVEVMANMLSVALQRTRAEEQRRLLLARLVTAQEEERRSIAGDIHDDAVQVMTAANMRLEILRRQLGDAAEVETVERLQQTVSLSIQRLRHLLFELSPPALERYGLVSALRIALNQLQDETNIEVVIRGTLLAEPDMARRTLAYRVFQEAVANVRRHSQATRVELTVEEEEAGGTAVTITDDGVGFVVASVADPKPGHLGITGMRERMDLAGGSLKITSEVGAGTTVRLWLPPSSR